MERSPTIVGLMILAVATLCAGCGRDYYQRSADREVYGILGERQAETLGKTNSNFTVNTRYSSRKPKDIRSPEIIHERLMSAKQPMSLTEALKTAVSNSREYQYKKETVYLTALALTAERYNFRPKWAASSKMTFARDSNGEMTRKVESDISATELFKTGGQLAVSIANDLLRYYTGDPRAKHTTLLAASLLQPLWRGGGWVVATEKLTQAERNVIYDVRDFAHYERTFAVDIVTSYFRLLQQKDTVRNEYNNYKNLVLARERAEALSVDRLPALQVDQARQDELKAKSSYIVTVQRYQSALDDFKIKLGLPLGLDLALDDAPLNDLQKLGVPALSLTDDEAHRIAVQYRLDLQNEIDKFEDSKRKIEVAANQLLPDFNIFGNVSLDSVGPTDYSRFDVNQYRWSAGVELKLPLDRLTERNAFRTTLISFERQLRALALALDNVRDQVREDLRTLEQARKDYDIQATAVKLAERRVESAMLLLQAGRAAMRDMLEAQSALVSTRNAWTAALVNYHAARWALLRDLGVIRTDLDRFWLAPQEIPRTGAPAAPAAPAAQAAREELIPPEELFK